MEVRLCPRSEQFVRSCVEGGRYRSAEDVMDAALQLLETQGGGRETLSKAVSQGFEQIIAGRSAVIGVDDIKRRALRKDLIR